MRFGSSFSQIDRVSKNRGRADLHHRVCRIPQEAPGQFLVVLGHLVFHASKIGRPMETLRSGEPRMQVPFLRITM